MADTSARLVPNCKVLVDGSPLDPPVQASLVRLSVDLDADLFGQTTLLFSDPQMKLMAADTFACGAAVKVKLGYGSTLEAIFDGEVVRLEPQFRKDQPIALCVVCQEPMHRLALSQSTRALNDVDVSGIVTQIAQEHGFSSDAPTGTKQYGMQGNISNATMLRRLGSRLGLRVRVEGKKLIMGPPPSTDAIPLLMSDGIRKVKVKLKSAGQVSSITVHGWDQKNKQEVVGTAKPQGEIGQGGTSYGDGDALEDSSGDNLPPDQSTAEAMAQGRMQKLNLGYIKSQTDMIGDARMIPGQTVSFDKMGPGIDGTWRIERAMHDFSRRGYFVKMESVRISAKKPAPPAPPVKTQDPDKPLDAGQLIRPRWKRRVDGQNDVADMAVDASKALEGKSIKFILETKVDGDWKQVATAQGTVSSGTATATSNLDQLDTSDFSNPKWTAAKDSQHTHGDSGEVSMTAKAKEGVEVRVILEQQVGKGWERVAQKISSVKSGEVKATFTLDHPFAAEAGKPDNKLLKLPSWTQHAITHGGSGALQVRAPGLPDGRTVQFDVERLGADGKWTLVRTVQGKIDHGTASLSLPDLRHPAHNQQPAHADVLKNPTWDKTALTHGDAGKFSVEAPDLDGRTVAFIVERNDNNSWTQLVRTMAKVASGKAEATASFAHPVALTKKAGAAGKKVKPALSNPRWDSQQATHGDELKALIDAAGLDGKTVEFIAERREVGGWVEAGRARGVVSGGKASAAITVLHPLTDQPDPSTADAASTVAPALSNPRWGTQTLTHGEPVDAIIDAVGLEGATVEFVAERLEVGGWVEAGRATGTVSGGTATASIDVEHPETDTSLRKLRFHAQVLSDPDDALDAPLPTQYDPKTGKVTASTGGDHDGRSVRFMLEQRSAIGWTAIATAVSRASKGSASAQLPTSSAQLAGTLSKPRWGANSMTHGDDAEMVVDAQGLDGQKVKFTVERLNGSTWTGVGAAVAVVSGGQATGSVTVSHPQGDETTAQELAQLRFRAELVGKVETRARAELLPDLDPRHLRFRASVVDDPTDPAEGNALQVQYDPKTGAASTTLVGANNDRMVRFVLEEKSTTGWTALASVTGRVAKGQVQVKLPVHHKANAKLANPRWAKQAMLHGDQAQLVVDAKGLDGHRVKFTVERLDDGQWSEVGNSLARVARGQAVGSVTVQHPGGDAQVSTAKLRFRAELLDGPVTRARAELLPDIDPRRLRFRAELVPDYTTQKLRFVAKPVPDLLPKRIRFRGELPVPLDPTLTRMRASVVGGGADDVQAGGASSS